MKRKTSDQQNLSAIAGALAAVVGIAGLALPGARWIGSKQLTLSLPPGYGTASISFYECHGTLDELITSGSPRDDFIRTHNIEIVDATTVKLSLTTTGVDGVLWHWFDRKTEPTFILCLAEDAEGNIVHRLVAQNRVDCQTAIAVALADMP